MNDKNDPVEQIRRGNRLFFAWLAMMGILTLYSVVWAGWHFYNHKHRQSKYWRIGD